MTKNRTFALLTIVGCIVLGAVVSTWATGQEETAQPKTRLAVVWTTGDPEVAHKMLLMYVNASQRSKWFDENLVIVWGPSARLLAADKELQAKVEAMMKAGVQFQACVACADMYGVADDLRALGLEVKGMGKPLSDLLQDDDWHVMTF